VLDDFDAAADAESDLPPWAVPGGVAPKRAARRAPRRAPERPGDDREWPGDRALGRPPAARHGLVRPEGAPSGPPRHGSDPYDDPRGYDEPPGYSRPPGNDQPRGYPARGYDRPGPAPARGYDGYGQHEQPRGYEEPDRYDAHGAPANGAPDHRAPDHGTPGNGESRPYPVPGRRSRGGTGDGEAGRATARRLRLPGRSRAAAARRRRSKRRLLTWGGAAVVIAALVAGGLYLTRSQAKNPHHYQTTFLKGEVRAVPSACKVLSAATLHQVMAGTPQVQPVGGAQGQSECTFTVDSKPAFRVVQIQEQAFSPSLAVPAGNGGATANAAWNFAQAKAQLAKPGKRSVWPAATFSPVSGLGEQAVSAVQASRGQVVTDRVTVLVRYRNVLVQVQVQGQAQEHGGFAPVPVASLRAAALTAVRGTFAAVRRQPTV